MVTALVTGTEGPGFKTPSACLQDVSKTLPVYPAVKE